MPGICYVHGIIPNYEYNMHSVTCGHVTNLKLCMLYAVVYPWYLCQSHATDFKKESTMNTTMNTTIVTGQPLQVGDVVYPYVIVFGTEADAKAYAAGTDGNTKIVHKENDWLVVLVGDTSAREFLVDMYKLFGKTKNFMSVVWSAFVFGCKDALAEVVAWFKSVPSLVQKGIASMKALFAGLKTGDKRSWVNVLLSTLLVVAVVVTAVVCPVGLIYGAAVGVCVWYVLDRTGKLDVLVDWFSGKVDYVVEKLENGANTTPTATPAAA